MTSGKKKKKDRKLAKTSALAPPPLLDENSASSDLESDTPSPKWPKTAKRQKTIHDGSVPETTLIHDNQSAGPSVDAMETPIHEDVTTPDNSTFTPVTYKLSPSPDFTTAYHALKALEDNFPSLRVSARPDRDANYLITPKDQESLDIIKGTLHIGEVILPLTALPPLQSRQKVVVEKVPLQIPVTAFECLPGVLEAKRCIWRITKQETRQVVLTYLGDPPQKLDLGLAGTFSTRPYTREPLRCFHCQRFGHHKERCHAPERCGVCSGWHPTSACISLLRDGQHPAANCPNCSGRHHVWNLNCPERLHRLKVLNPDLQPRPQPARTFTTRPFTWYKGRSNTSVPVETNVSRTTGATDGSVHVPLQRKAADSSVLTGADFPSLPVRSPQVTRPPPSVPTVTSAPPTRPLPPVSPNTTVLPQFGTSPPDLSTVLQTALTAVLQVCGLSLDHSTVTSLVHQALQHARQQPTPLAISPNQGLTPATANINVEKHALGPAPLISRSAQQHRSADLQTAQSPLPQRKLVAQQTAREDAPISPPRHPISSHPVQSKPESSPSCPPDSDPLPTSTSVQGPLHPTPPGSPAPESALVDCLDNNTQNSWEESEMEEEEDIDVEQH